MPVEVLREMTPSDVRVAVDGFSPTYAADWETWLNAPLKARPELFGRTLRKWQATRPREMRRLRSEANHGAPFLEDLLELATEPIRVLVDLDVMTVGQRTRQQDEALNGLWRTFSQLTTTELASCVGITKAVLLLTDGRIGPAFDSNVQKRLSRPETCDAWVRLLEEIGEDIAVFESAHGPLAQVVPSRFAQVGYGRLFDMILGPRERSSPTAASPVRPRRPPSPQPDNGVERALDELLAAAAAADGMGRIEFRDRIAAFGEFAIRRLEPWLRDARLARFAILTINRVAAQPDAADAARASLKRGRAGCAESVRGDIDAALARLGRSARSVSSFPAAPAFHQLVSQWAASSAAEAQFDQAMLDIYSLAGRETGYWAGYFLRAVRKDGGLETARKLLWKTGTSKGFERLKEEGRLDLSMEALMLRPEFRELFSEAELDRASDRLAEHGYRLDRDS
jgi:hypothetical protein